MLFHVDHANSQTFSGFGCLPGSDVFSDEDFRLIKGVPTRGALYANRSNQAIVPSICANLAEAWRKRRYKAAFISKLNDAETEASETQVHLEIAFHHHYIDQETFEKLDDECDKVIAQIVKMIDQADRWIIKPPTIGRRSTR